MNNVWVEKYRPKRLDDIFGQDIIVKGLKSYVESKNIPHLLFSGNAGTGKTACAVTLARELYGDGFSYNFMELNGSDERGIDTIRNKIKNFARSATVGELEFKLIFLDEADALTTDAQSALRRIMEIYSDVCRFILACNYQSKISEPIQSRCAIYKFGALPNEAMTNRLKFIATTENLELNDGVINAILYVSKGDMRRAINVLQSASMINKKIDVDIIYNTTMMAQPEDVRELIKLGLENKFEDAFSKLNYLMNKQGLAGEDLVIQMFDEIFTLKIPSKTKIRLIDSIGEINFRISEGANPRIQMAALLSKFMMI